MVGILVIPFPVTCGGVGGCGGGSRVIGRNTISSI